MFSRRYSDQDIIDAVAKSRRLCDVIEYLGLRKAGGNFKTIKKCIKILALDTSHFFYYQDQPLKSKEETIFIENSKVSGKTVKKYLLKKNILPYRCCICDLSTWNEKPLILQLDHTNGIFNDNRIENLRWLCPNCHSQTPTYRGRNKSISQRVQKTEEKI